MCWPAANKHHRFTPCQKPRQAFAGDCGHKNIALHKLRMHGLKIFILQGRLIMGIAHDHDIPGRAQSGFGCARNRGHDRIVQVCGEQRDSPALPAAQRLADDIGTVAHFIHQLAHARHGLRIGAMHLAIGNTRHRGGRYSCRRRNCCQ